MRRIFFASIILLLFLSCQKKSEPTAKDSAADTIKYSRKEKIIPQKAVKNDKSSTEKDNKIYKIMEVDIRPDYVGGIQKFYSFLNKNYVMPKDPDSNDALQGGVFSIL